VNLRYRRHLESVMQVENPTPSIDAYLPEENY